MIALSASGVMLFTFLPLLRSPFEKEFDKLRDIGLLSLGGR
jgi:hypothetical protein